MQTITREQWDGSTRDQRRFSRVLVPSRVRGVVAHYPGTGVRSYHGLSISAVARVLRGFRDYHRRFRVWPDIGYCAAVDWAGNLYDCAGFKIAAHSATPAYPAANRERIGLLLVLGDNEPVPPAMRDRVASFRADVRADRLPFAGWQAVPNAVELHGHRQMRGASTQCPGDPVTALILRRGFEGGSRTDEREPIATPGWARVQRILRDAGYDPGPIDGIAGPQSRGAVREYQDGQFWPYLRATGRWDTATEAHAVWTGELQHKLNAWRDRWETRLPRLRTDLDYGDVTASMVRAWQVRNPRFRGDAPGQAGWSVVAGLNEGPGKPLRRHP